LAYVLINFFYLIVVILNIGMAKIIHVHHVDKEAYLKGNIEPDPDELDLVFERTHTYVEVLEQVRIEVQDSGCTACTAHHSSSALTTSCGT
jgi:hypothetical protein